MTQSERPAVAVIGGGITGLAAAWALTHAQPAVRVVLIEESDRLGGKIASADLDGLPIEKGPDGFVGAGSYLSEIATALGLGDEIVSARTAPVHLFSRGRIRTLPQGLVMGLPVSPLPVLRSRLLSLRELARAGADLVLPRSDLRDDVSIGRLAGDRMGRGVVERLVEPLLGGVYAGDVSLLSADAVLPGLRTRLRNRRSLIATLRAGGAGGGSRGLVTLCDGLTALVAAIEQRLRERGCEIRTGCAVQALERNGDGWRVRFTGGAAAEVGGVLVTTPAPAAAHLLTPVVPAAADLASVPYASLAVVVMRFPRSAVPDAALLSNGILVPRADGLLLRACTWVTAKWPHREDGESVIVRCSAGSYGDERAAHLDDAALVAHLTGELRTMTGLTGDPAGAVVTRWRDAMPQYLTGHRERVATVRAALPGGIALAGAAYDGVGITTCAGTGRDVALSLAAELTERPAAEPAHA